MANGALQKGKRRKEEANPHQEVRKGEKEEEEEEEEEEAKVEMEVSFVIAS